MSIPGIASSANLQASIQQLSPSTGHHKHGVHAPSLSDVDAQSSSVAGQSQSSGRPGSRVDITV